MSSSIRKALYTSNAPRQPLPDTTSRGHSRLDYLCFRCTAGSQTSISSDAINGAKQDHHEVIYEATEELEHVLPPSRPYHVAENTHACNFMNESANDCSSVVKQRAPQLGGAIKYVFRLSLFDSYSRVRLCHSHIHLVLTFCLDT
jgi:hypothetical protein